MELEGGPGRAPQPSTRIYPLTVQDWSGRERRGQIVFERRYSEESATPAADEDFRILILAEPLDTPITPPERVVVCLPQRRLPLRHSVGEPAATYEVRQGQPLSLEEVELLAQGRFLSALTLTVGPEQVFIPGEEASLDLLAADLLLQRPQAVLLRPGPGLKRPGPSLQHQAGGAVGPPTLPGRQCWSGPGPLLLQRRQPVAGD